MLPETEPAEPAAEPLDLDPERAPAAIHPLFLTFFALFALAMLFLPLRHTLELWDESRNANNAVEMVMRGHFLAPTYGFRTDHWNTKPPLLLWIIAGLEKLHVPPVAALRLPSAAAALCSVMALYWFVRRILHRPFVAIVAGTLLMSSTLFFGLHVSMSGDYDALLCLFTTLYTLGFFVFAEDIRPFAGAGIAVAGVALAGAVLTKGIAGVLLLPGLVLYLVIRRRLARTLVNWRFWAAFLGAAALIALYYLGRNHLDPGYLHDVWTNELGGRFNQANEGHHARTLFYANYLVHHFEPGLPLLLLSWFTFRRPLKAMAGSLGQPESSLAAAQFSGIVSLTFLLVLTVSRTKIFYYCAPAIPLLSLLAALGLTDTLLLLCKRHHWHLPAVQTGTFGILAMLFAMATSFGLNDGRAITGGEQAQYGDVLAAMRPSVQVPNHRPMPVLLLDPGFDTNARFVHYDPIAEYYAKEATRAGMPVIVVPNLQVPGTKAPQPLTATGTPVSPVEGVPVLTPGTWLVSCDPRTVLTLAASPALHNVSNPALNPGVHDCIFGQL